MNNIKISISLNSFDKESLVLKQLLIRNYNQHRKTKIYSFMSEIYDIIHKLLHDCHILEISNECDELLQHLQKASVSSLTRHRVLKCLSLCYHFEIILSKLIIEADYWFVRVGMLLRIALAEGLFIPLYSMWIAIVATMSDANIILLKFLLTQHISLFSELQVSKQCVC